MLLAEAVAACREEVRTDATFGLSNDQIRSKEASRNRL